MANTIVPNIDAAICAQWTQQDINLYNRLPFYLVKMQLKYLKNFQIWSNLCGKVRWQPNMGQVMRSVSKEPSPHFRQFAFPNEISTIPVKDIMDVRERTVDALVLKQRFESMTLNFVPSFRDFLKDHVDKTAEDITQKITRFHDVFARGNIYTQSPYVFIPNRDDGQPELTPCPMNIPITTFDTVNLRTIFTGGANTFTNPLAVPSSQAGFDASGAKDGNWMQATFPLIGNPGNLSLNNINLMLNVMETDLRIPPFQGTLNPSGDNAPLNGKYVLVCSGEAYNQFIYDPWLLSYKQIDLNIITDVFKGSLFGRVTCRLEDLPIRISVDGTFPVPELRELNPNAFNYGESVPNPKYTSAPFEVAFFVGYGDAYDLIEVGPPPKDFSGNGMPKGFGNMFWNGELMITKNLLTTCLDVNGNTVIDTNKYGELLQIISQATFGIVGKQKRAIVPFIFKRWRGAQRPVNSSLVQ